MNPHALNRLLQVWPRGGARSAAECAELNRVANAIGCRIDPRVSRDQLRRTVCNCQHRWAINAIHKVDHRGEPSCVRTAAAVPWKYQKYLKPHQNIRQQAIKIQPGVTIPIALNGMETTMYVDTARRLQFRGKPWFIELKVKLNTEHIPVILTRESKCDCLYCGASPVSDEDSCRKCGAPLSDCT